MVSIDDIKKKKESKAIKMPYRMSLVDRVSQIINNSSMGPKGCGIELSESEAKNLLENLHIEEKESSLIPFSLVDKESYDYAKEVIGRLYKSYLEFAEINTDLIYVNHLAKLNPGIAPERLARFTIKTLLQYELAKEKLEELAPEIKKIGEEISGMMSDSSMDPGIVKDASKKLGIEPAEPAEFMASAYSKIVLDYLSDKLGEKINSIDDIVALFKKAKAGSEEPVTEKYIKVDDGDDYREGDEVKVTVSGKELKGKIACKCGDAFKLEGMDSSDCIKKYSSLYKLVSPGLRISKGKIKPRQSDEYYRKLIGQEVRIAPIGEKYVFDGDPSPKTGKISEYLGFDSKHGHVKFTVNLDGRGRWITALEEITLLNGSDDGSTIMSEIREALGISAKDWKLAEHYGRLESLIQDKFGSVAGTLLESGFSSKPTRNEDYVGRKARIYAHDSTGPSREAPRGALAVIERYKGSDNFIAKFFDHKGNDGRGHWNIEIDAIKLEGLSFSGIEGRMAEAILKKDYDSFIAEAKKEMMKADVEKLEKLEQETSRYKAFISEVDNHA